MAMGGNGKVFSSNSNSKGRSYAMMLLMAFGAAIFAIMLLQKFRERRIFNLLIKEKDLELFSLHLLLQNEREHTKELKKNISELKEKVYSIRTEKINIESQILEMQSKISSLIDEQNTAESVLGEKENEITMMKKKETVQQDNSELIILNGLLKQKDAAIEDLKHQLENQGSVRSDQLLNANVNSTKIGSLVVQNNIVGDTPLKEAGDENDDRRKMITQQNLLERHGEVDKKLEATEENKIENVGIGVDDKNNMTNPNVETHSEGNRTTIEKENETQGDKNPEILKIPRENESHLEHQTTSPNLIVKGRRRHGYPSNTRGKRWKMIAKTRKLEHNIDFQLKKSNEHKNRNRGSVSINKLVEISNGNTVILKAGEGLPSRTADQDKKNEEVEPVKKVPEDPDESSDKNAKDDDVVDHVEPGLEVEDDREDYKDETILSEF